MPGFLYRNVPIPCWRRRVRDYPRFIFLFMAATCAVLMGVGLYLEHVVGLEPCPLCVMQRIFFILVGVWR